MKNITAVISVIVLFAVTACHRSSGQTSDNNPVAEDTAAASSPRPFKPFDVVQINHAVKDYSKWKPAFDNDSIARKASGLDYIVMGAQDDNTNNMAIFLQASDVAKAKAFATDPRLKNVMEKNGIVSNPEINYWHVIRFNPDSKEKHWVTVTHKVKDFDAWVKVFDGVGTAKRLEEGLVDVVLARGIDDPNMVFLVFDINDMTKAKAAISSAEKKNLMKNAGVEGEPAIVFYTEPQ